MKTHFSPRPVATASALALILAACGGGGGGGDSIAVTSSPPTGGGGGIGGSGQSNTSSGTIDGFGSIFVNGVRFDTDNAEVVIDGEVRGEDALRLGMVVLVTGEVDDDGANGTAQRVQYDNELTGPISRIEVSADGNSKLLTILGINVIVERAGTVFDDVTFATLVVDDVVEVSGFTGRGDSLRATRVERESAFVAGETRVTLSGQVGVVTGTDFVLGDLTVDFSAAELEDIPGGAIAEGQTVRVRGTLNGTVVTASRIEAEQGPGSRFQEGETAIVQGAITRYASPASFRVGGVDIDATSAVLRPADLSLTNGLVVQVQGTWDGSQLLAERVDTRRGRIKVEAPVSNVDLDSLTLTLQLVPGTVTVQLDARTRLDDDTDQVEDLALADIFPGDFLEVEAFLDGDTLFATTIDRDDDNDHVLQGPVQSFNPGVDITILGLAFSTAGAQFEDRDDDEISSELFFASVEVGDLVKIKDDDPADGTADEVEFEDRDTLEGEREFACFGDDDSLDDDSVDDSSDGCDDFSDDSQDESGDDDLADDDLTDDDDDLTDDDDDVADDDDDLMDGEDGDDLMDEDSLED
ncbi:MAG: DUF5666 domain-containing protein [Haliea sp.]|uniref:DUF5666 domain-containing protein n=1 Tax=Haliea sp. TaxID=1932666 RepID=UPI0032EAF12A